MEKFLKSLTRDKHSLILSLLLSCFVICDIEVPLVLAELIDNPIGKIGVAVLALSLLSKNTLAGVVGIVAAYVLIQRSEGKTGSYGERNFLPSENKKLSHFNSMNQFPHTLEEDIVNTMLPMNRNVDLSSPEFKPVLEDNHDADITR
jgi:hypothetical protein